MDEDGEVARVYRCGFCSHDFVTLERCLSHLTSHPSEQDQAPEATPSSSSISSTSADVVSSEQQTETFTVEGSAAQGTCSAPISVCVETSGTDIWSKLSSITEAALAVNKPDPALQSSSTQTSSPSTAPTVDPVGVGAPIAVREETTAVAQSQTSQMNSSEAQTSHPSSIIVQTGLSGAIVMKMRLGQSAGDVSHSAHHSSHSNGESVMLAEHLSEKMGIIKTESSVHDVISCEEVCEEQQGFSNGQDGDLTKHLVQASYEEVKVVARRFSHSCKPQVSQDNADDRPYTCSECPARYRFLSSLSVHKKRHSGAEPYHCKTCKKKFWHPTNLRVHERVHAKERLYTCKVCGHGFNQANDLRIHARIHTGETPLTCSVEGCNKAFRDPACLRRHVNNHRGVQPHIACDQCSACFFHPSGLARHYKRHTGQKDHQCPFCHAAFARRDTLKLHMRIHSGYKPYTCSHCQQSFSDRSYCRRHIAKHDNSHNARIISTLRHDRRLYVIMKKEGEEKEEEEGGGDDDDSGDDVAMETEPQEEEVVEEEGGEREVQSQPVLLSSSHQSFKPPVMIPVDVHVPEIGESHDIPSASIEIEIPESDLVNGEGLEEMVYQYGDMLITISCSAMKMASDISTSAPSAQDLERVVNPDLSVTVPLSLQHTEHQYSRGQSAKIEEKPASTPSELVGVASRLSHGGSNPVVMVKAGSMVVPQPLSEYNEIVTTTASTATMPMVESSLDAEGRQVQFRIMPGSRDKQRNARIGEKRWRCPDCNSAFFHKAELKRHQTKHTGELPYQCTICGKKVRDPSNLKRHVRTHTGERPYSCSVCGKMFRQAGHLSAHVRIHTGQRPYRCDLCPATFIEANHLRYHQKVHAGIKPYRCPHCDLSFIRNAELKRHSHVHTHGSEGNLQCPVCPAKFFRSDGLRQHLSKKHEQYLPYHCDVCTQSFSRQSLLERHCAKTGHTHTPAPLYPPKSNTENNVVADALCELAAGRRESSSENVKDPEHFISDMAGTDQEPGCLVSNIAGSSHDSISALIASTRTVSGSGGSDSQALGATHSMSALTTPHKEVQARTAVSSLNREKCDGGVVMQGSGGAVSGRSSDHFVQRVLVDGGSICGSRMVLVQAGGMAESLSFKSIQPAGELDGTESQSSLGQIVNRDRLLPHTDRVRDLATQDVSGHIHVPPTGVEDPAANTQSTAVIINGAEQIIELAVPQNDKNDVISYDNKTEVIDQFPNSSLTTQIVKDGLSARSSEVGDSNNENIHFIMPQNADSTGCQPDHTEQTASNTDNNLESTMQLLVSGNVTLEAVPLMEAGGRAKRGRGRLGAKQGGELVLVKEEPGQVSSLRYRGQRPVVAPLRTRSGRERKIRVKLSL